MDGMVEMVVMVEIVEMVEMVGFFLGGGAGCPELFLDVTQLHKVGRKVLDTSFQAPVLAEINHLGRVGVGRLDQMKLRLTDV